MEMFNHSVQINKSSFSNNSILPQDAEKVDNTSTILEFAIQGVGVLSVATAGIVSNLLCLLVLSQPTLKRGHGSVNFILMSLAAIDILVKQKVFITCFPVNIVIIIFFVKVVTCAILMCGIPSVALFGIVFNCTDNAGKYTNLNKLF